MGVREEYAWICLHSGPEFCVICTVRKRGFFNPKYISALKTARAMLLKSISIVPFALGSGFPSFASEYQEKML